MLIRTAIALFSASDGNTIANSLVRYSLLSEADTEMDISFYDSAEKLLDNYINIDQAFILCRTQDKKILAELYRRNTECIPIVSVSPAETIGDFLMLRPAGYLNGADDEQSIADACKFCEEAMPRRNDVIQISTRERCCAVSASSVVYCQSDLKYIILVTEQGEVFRKLGKLQDISAKLPPYFLRVHQSYIVNTEHIAIIDKSSWEITTKEGYRIPVSRTYRNEALVLSQKCSFKV